MNKFKSLEEANYEEGQGEVHAAWAPSRTTPISIVNALFRDEDAIMPPILDKITVDLIRYIKHYFEKPVDPKSKFRGVVKNLFEMFKQQLNCVWRALGTQLSQEIRHPLREG